MKRRIPLLLTLALVGAVLYGARSMIARAFLYPIPVFSVGTPPPELGEVSLEVAGVGRAVAWESRHLAAATARPQPAVLFLHGNGENLETLRHSGLYDQLGALGVRFLVLDYPGYGRSEGTPSEKSLVAAAQAGVAHLREQHPESPVVVFGWSLGAAVAIQVAAREEGLLSGLILASAWDDLPELAAAFFPRWLVKITLVDRYDSLAAAPELSCPVLMLHGRRDRIVAIEHGRRLYEALPPGARWLELPGAGHNDLLGQPDVWREIADFLDYLR